MIYNNLIIQSKIWAKLNNYLEKKTLPHAFLFYGNDGVGKEAHAIELARESFENIILSICKTLKKLEKEI